MPAVSLDPGIDGIVRDGSFGFPKVPVFGIFDPSTLPGPFIAIPIGLLFWIVGAKTLRKVNAGIYAHEEKDVRKLLIGNTILFVLSCLIWGASIIIPMLTMCC